MFDFALSHPARSPAPNGRPHFSSTRPLGKPAWAHPFRGDGKVWLTLTVCLSVLLCSNVGAQTTALESVLVSGQSEGLGLPRPISHLVEQLGASWFEQAVSGAVMPAHLLRESGAQGLGGALQFDASVDPNYTPLGYYESYQIRGFPVDPILGLRINGVPIVGESPITLDNKNRVEVIHGPAGAWMGAGTSAGLINLLTKRPSTLNEYGLRWGSQNSLGATVDVGRASSEGGWRLNAASDRLRPLARGANGEAHLIAMALDRKFSADSRFEFDLELNRHAQITQPGSQLLGGTALPPIDPKTVLGLSPWSQPVTFDSVFTMGRFIQKFNAQWQIQTTASMHQVTTADRSSFPWGCSAQYGSAAGATFCRDGAFTLWDYRSEHETRRSTFGEMMATGAINGLGLRHEIATGLSLTRRTTHLPNYVWDYAVADTADTGNVFSRTWTGGASSTAGTDVSESILTQANATVSDRVQWSDTWSIAAQGRWVQHREDYRAQFPYYTPIAWMRHSLNRFLPALAVQRNLSPAAMSFISYREDIAAGERAPLGAANNGELLPARVLKSVEIGLKLAPSADRRLSLTAFHAQRPFHFRDDTSLSEPAGSLVSRGTETRTGLELGLFGTLTPRLEGQFSATSMFSTTHDTAAPLADSAPFEGKQALNTPRFRSASFLSYRLEEVENLRFNTTWIYTGKRPAARDNSVYAPAFHRVDTGLSWSEKDASGRRTYRFMIENVFNQRYWRDVAEFLGDSYLTPGMPRQFKVSANLSF